MVPLAIRSSTPLSFPPSERGTGTVQVRSADFGRLSRGAPTQRAEAHLFFFPRAESSRGGAPTRSHRTTDLPATITSRPSRGHSERYRFVRPSFAEIFAELRARARGLIFLHGRGGRMTTRAEALLLLEDEGMMSLSRSREREQEQERRALLAGFATVRVTLAVSLDLSLSLLRKR